MRKVVFCFLIVLVFSHCESSVDKQLKPTTSQVENMIELENKIYSLQNDTKKIKDKLKLGGELYNNATKFINQFPEDDQIEKVYVLAAIGAEANEKFDNAINYYYLAQRNFPESEKAAEYLFNRARILDNILIKKKEARLAYEELIELYPNDSLSHAMKLYLESDILEKSDQEIIEFLQSKN